MYLEGVKTLMNSHTDKPVADWAMEIAQRIVDAYKRENMGAPMPTIEVRKQNLLDSIALALQAERERAQEDEQRAIHRVGKGLIFKEAVVTETHPVQFYDGYNEGVNDFMGAIRKRFESAAIRKGERA